MTGDGRRKGVGGRPRLDPQGGVRVTLGHRVAPETLRYLRAVAARQGVSVGRVLDEMVRARREREERERA